ncbi:hypothetical protein ACJRO7_026534 [Eucalyptus globulus]|uniref:Uncharacterized protein n=1 Tax=Eucalyptus globulus TaxID=34317 RepID=A0ABD3JPR3_EUCGL
MEVLYDVPLPLWVHGQCVKGARVLQRHRFPPAARISVKEAFLVLTVDVVGLVHDVVQVGVEDELIVALPDPELEATLLVREGPPRGRLGLPLPHHMLPLDGNAVKDVNDAVIV